MVLEEVSRMGGAGRMGEGDFRFVWLRVSVLRSSYSDPESSITLEVCSNIWWEGVVIVMFLEGTGDTLLDVTIMF